MNIIVDLSVLELPATGIAKVITGLYRAVAAQRPDILLRGIHRRPLASALPPSIRTDRVSSLLTPGLWRRFGIRRALRHSIDSVLHFPWNGQVPLLPREMRVVTTMHDVLPLTIPGYFAREDLAHAYQRERQADIDRSSVVITDSEFSKREITRHLRVEREPIVIPCGTDIGTYAATAAKPGYPYFLYVGGLDPRKSVDMLLRVFVRLASERMLDSKLIVTGSRRHAPASITTLLDDGVRRGHILYRGYVDDDELANLYAGALGLVYPSRYEGFGMPPLEAMTLGCPVITCREASIPEVCGEAAYYVTPADERSLTTALTTIERDPAMRLRLASEGRARAAKFSWDRAAKKFLDVLELSFPSHQ